MLSSTKYFNRAFVRAIVLRSNRILDTSFTAVTKKKANAAGMSEEHKKKVEKEILRDIIDTIHQPGANKPDTIIRFPLARWLSKTIIERIKFIASLNNQPKAVISMLQKVNGKYRVNPAAFREYTGYEQMRSLDSTFVK